MSTNDTDIEHLSLNDTFYDWYIKTNLIIDYVNPVNVYDVSAGNGLTESRTGTPGTVELSVATDPTLYGITTLTNTDGISEVVLDYSSLTEGTVSDTSLFSFQDGGSQIFKVEASDMLPENINGDHAFGGTITVADLIVNDGTITLNTTGTDRDTTGIIVESLYGTDGENVTFTYDQDTLAWYSSEYFGIKDNKGFVTDTAGDAVYTFIATETQAQVDLQLETTVSGTPERFSIYAQFDASNTLTFSHYANGVLTNDILELTANGTAGSDVVVKDTITITDVLNSTPFSQSPAVESVPVTDSTDGFLNDFVNRVILTNNGASAGDFVYVNASGEATPTDASAIGTSYQVGIVESVDGSDVTIITSGSFSGLLSGLTAGDIYYLDDTTPGAVTDTNPENTSGTVGKPVFIATSATSGILIPDFTGIGSGIVSVGGGSVNDAYKIITVDATSITASGEDEIIFISGNNITLTGDAGLFQVTVDCDIPEPTTGDSYSLLTSDSSSSYAYTSVGEYSVVGRVSDGEVDSVAMTEGTILGRGSDTDDNGVEALTPSKVLDILGFSSNSYLKNVEFLDSAGSTVYSYPESGDGETLYIREGDYITFSKSGNDLYINAFPSTDGIVIGGGGGPINIAVEGEAYSEIENLIFDDGSYGYTQFDFAVTTGTTGRITATPTASYIPIATDSGSGSHQAGKTLRFFGDSYGIDTSFTSASTTETITLGLNETLDITQITARSNGDSLYLGIAGKEDQTDIGASFVFKDTSVGQRNLDSTFDYGDTTTSQSTIIFDGWDSISFPDSNRTSTYNVTHNRCVSLYADTPDTASGGESYTLPFRFYELLVDKITVADLTVTTATKTTEYLGTLVGNYLGADRLFSSDDLNTVKIATYPSGSPSGADGINLMFHDVNDATSTSNRSFIKKPSKTFINSDLSRNIPYNSLIIGDNLVFGSHSNSLLYSPALSRGSSNDVLSIDTASSLVELSLTNSSAGTTSFDIGMQSNTYSYLNFNDGTTDWYLHIREDAEWIANTLNLTNDASGGFALTIDTFSASDTGKVMMITDVDSNGKATVEPTYVIKPYSDGSDALTDPINTLYYVI